MNRRDIEMKIVLWLASLGYAKNNGTRTFRSWAIKTGWDFGWLEISRAPLGVRAEVVLPSNQYEVGDRIVGLLYSYKDKAKGWRPSLINGRRRSAEEQAELDTFFEDIQY